MTIILTRRQKEIALLYITGLRKKEVGDRLGISTKTIESTLYTVYRKLGICSSAQLAVELIRWGYLEAPERKRL